MADEGGSIQGTVTEKSGNPVIGAWVRVMPVKPGQREQRKGGRFGRTAHQGNFLIQGIIPGKYHLYAVGDPNSLAELGGNFA